MQGYNRLKKLLHQPFVAGLDLKDRVHVGSTHWWVGRLLFNVSVETEGYTLSSRVKIAEKLRVLHTQFLQ